MSLRVVFRRAARKEFDEAVNWYGSNSVALANEFILEIEQAVSAAASSPQRFPQVFGDVRRAVTRRFPYAIYFRTRHESLIVLAIFHGRRNPVIWQGRI
ncbi:MAG: type II toxin-antitoxin system RelE/ParE family toxin [Burkholderiales bacterium]